MTIEVWLPPWRPSISPRGTGRRGGIVDVDLTVPPGVVFGFLGPNGAGKTTTIRLLMDFLRPTVGTARVLGLDSTVESVEIHRRDVAS